MEEYKSNSYKNKVVSSTNPPEKKIEQVVDGAVKTKKKEINKFRDIFISEDAANVKSYIFMDVLVPAIKKAVKDIVTDGIEMILYGESGRRKQSGTNASYVSYNRLSDRRDDDRFRNDSRSYSGYNFDDIVLKTRGDAEEVLSSMEDIIDRYGVVSVSDMYEMVNLKSNFTDNKYGWTNLRNASIVRDRDGYIIRLPKALPIN